MTAELQAPTFVLRLFKGQEKLWKVWLLVIGANLLVGFFLLEFIGIQKLIETFGLFIMLAYAPFYLVLGCLLWVTAKNTRHDLSGVIEKAQIRKVKPLHVVAIIAVVPLLVILLGQYELYGKKILGELFPMFNITLCAFILIIAYRYVRQATAKRSSGYVRLSYAAAIATQLYVGSTAAFYILAVFVFPPFLWFSTKETNYKQERELVEKLSVHPQFSEMNLLLQNYFVMSSANNFFKCLATPKSYYASIGIKNHRRHCSDILVNTQCDLYGISDAGEYEECQKIVWGDGYKK